MRKRKERKIMRKIKIISLALLVLTLVEMFGGVMTVHAATNGTLSHPKVPNVHYTRRGGGQAYMSAPYETYTMDGKTVYCIEPGVNIDTTDYIGEGGLINSPYDNETNKKLELIGHYGFDYPGHQTLRYRMATQALIWELAGGQIVEFWTEASGWGDHIDVSYEKNVIMNLVNNHYNKPSFNGSNINAVIGQEFVITDSNGLLSEYEIYKADGFQVRIEGNNIYAKATKTGNLSLSVVRKHYDNFTTIVFQGNGVRSQKMGYFRFSDPVLAAVNVKSIGGDVTINKLDNDNQNSTPQGEGTLAGAVYGVYDFSDNLITTITTDSEGYAKSGTLPDLGEYYLKEITPSKGYMLDENKYFFTLKENDLYPKIKVYENIIKRDVEVNKYYAKATTGTLEPEVGIEFGIYDKNGVLVKQIKTDEQGYAKTNLVYGTYTVKQLTTTPGHEKVEDFKIVINNDSPKTVKYSLSNAPIMAKLRLIKTDSESGKTIAYSGITFKIKDLKTNEYVCQKVTYPNKEEICEFKTDENGEFITPYPLTTGTYQIEEITSPKGYLLSDVAIIFTIDENTKIINDNDFGKYLDVNFSNQQIKGEIKINKTGEFIKIEKGTFTYEIKNLAGVEFSVYADEDIKTLDGITHYKKGDLVGTIKTDENGKAILDNMYLGKYIVKETKTLDGYVLDTKEYSVELKEIDNKTAIVSETLELSNKLKKGNLEFTKIDITTSEPIPNTTIEIYTEDDELIFSGKTDKNGKIVIEELKTGKYYILEKESATGFLLTDEKVDFEILEDGEIVKAKMTNKPITGGLEFTKVDISTGTPLPNTLIEIYNEKDELVFSGRTDENGKVIIEELRYGKYYILEKEAPEGYILNTERMYFEILEDGEIVKATMVNEKAVIDVPNTGVNDYHIIEIIGVLILISGIGVIAYAKKKRK